MWRAKPLSSIELRHLRYFLAAAEHGSFRKAGIALGVRESSISRGIHELEARLGVSLFDRHLAGSSLNCAGDRFLQETRMAIEHLGKGVMAVGAIGRGESGCIDIGIIPSLASGFLSKLLRSYNERYPGVRIDFIEGNPSEQVKAVRRRLLDVAFTTYPSSCRDCETIYLWSEQIFVVLSSTHHLVHKHALAWSDLAGERFIATEQRSDREGHDHLFKRLVERGQPADIRRQNVGRDNLMALVAMGCGLTLTNAPTTVAPFSEIVYRPIEGETVSFNAIWHARNENPALRRLLGLAKAQNAIARPTTGASIIILPAPLAPAGLSRTPDPSP